MDYSRINRNDPGNRSAYRIQACKIISKEDENVTVLVNLGKKSQPCKYTIADFPELKIGNYLDVAALINFNQDGYATSYQLAACGATPAKFVPKEEDQV